MRHASLLSLTTLALALGACPTHVLSPPTEFMPLEGPAVLDEGAGAVAVDGGYTQAMFGPEVIGGSLRYRHGLGADLELSGEGSVAWVLEDPRADTFRGIFSGRLGVKGLIVPGWPHLAWVAGLGGGGSAGGGFAAADAGVILGYENPYVVPFMRLSGVASLPVGARDVDITRVDVEPGTPAVVDRPHATFGLRGAFGLKVPVGTVDLHAGLGWVWLMDVRGERELFMGLSGGAAFRF